MPLDSAHHMFKFPKVRPHRLNDGLLSDADAVVVWMYAVYARLCVSAPGINQLPLPNTIGRKAFGVTYGGSLSMMMLASGTPVNSSD